MEFSSEIFCIGPRKFSAFFTRKFLPIISTFKGKVGSPPIGGMKGHDTAYRSTNSNLLYHNIRHLDGRTVARWTLRNGLYANQYSSKVRIWKLRAFFYVFSSTIVYLILQKMRRRVCSFLREPIDYRWFNASLQ